MRGRVNPRRWPAEFARCIYWIARGSVVFSALLYLALLGLVQSARAEVNQPQLAGTKINSTHPHFNDADLGALREYAQEIGAERPKLTRIAESTSTDPNHFDDMHALRDYARQIAGGHPAAASIEEGKSQHQDYNHFNDAALAALRDYVRQIGADQPNSMGAPRFKVAEADDALGALRELFGGRSQPDALAVRH
jgi:hypothetical protein